MDAQRNESVLRNLAEELLTEEECQHFKQALHHFRVSNSVTTLCQQLKPVINNTSKILLLVELNNRMPKALQDDFHRLCSLQFPNYDTYLKIFSNGNVSRSGSTRVIGQDSTGKLKVFNKSLEKRSSKYSNSKQTFELRSQPGTSVTSGVYSYASDDESDDVFTEEKDQNKGRATPVFVDGKNNVHKVFLDRHDDGSLGLGITGGKEYGSEIEINVVEDGGPAAKMGLKVGDKILEVNGHNFHNITHAEAVMIMRNAWNLIVLVERPTEQENTDLGNMMAKQHQIKSLDILVFPSTSGKLGCVSQRLPNQDLIVMSVEENSPAFKSGMRNFDLIYKIDGISVRGLSESQIVMLLNAKRISLSIKRYVPVPLQNGDITDAAKRAKSAPPTKHHQQLTSPYRSVSSPRSTRQRNKSSESRQNFQNVVYYSSDNNRNNHSANNAYMTLKGNPKPEHLVYGNRSVREPNWIISPKPREHRYTQRREVLRESTSHSYPNHVRSRSADPFQTHYVSASKVAVMSQGRASRYIRNRSKSPHRSTISRVHNEDNVIRAVQMGLEKRNRAVRESLHQMADPADYEWEIY